MKRLALVAAVAACGRGASPPPAPAPAPGSGSGPATPAAIDDRGLTGECTALPFAETTPVPEASGAAWLTIDGAPALVVISDSGNGGAYSIVDPETGATRETGRLPLGGLGEDLEGAAVRDGKLWAITSPGWVRSWRRVARGFELVDGPYALGPIDRRLGAGKSGDPPPAGDGMICDAERTNCGRNYEGLCLAPAGATGRCVGFAAAKADGHLYCLVERAGRLAIERGGAIRVARPGVLADCAFSADGALYAGANLFDLGKVYAITGWQDPPTAQVRSLGALGVGFPETLAVRGDVVYRMSDLGDRDPSAMKKFRCQRPPAR